MFEIECEGCQHDGQGHCFFWSFAVSEVTDRECLLAKNNHSLSALMRRLRRGY